MRPPLYFIPLMFMLSGCATPWRTSAAAGIQATAVAIDARTVEVSAAVETLYVNRALAQPDPDARLGETFHVTWAAQLFPPTPLSPGEFEQQLARLDDAALAYPAAWATVAATAWTGTQAQTSLTSARALSRDISATTTSLAAYYALPPLSDGAALLATELATLLEVETTRLQEAGGTP